MAAAKAVQLNSVADLLTVVRQIQDVLLGGAGPVDGDLLDYAPVLAADRARIEAEVYERVDRRVRGGPEAGLPFRGTADIGEWLNAESQRIDLDELIAAEYGGAAWVDDVAVGNLLVAYVRRKRFEERLIAGGIGRLFFRSDSQKMQRVPADELLKMMGVE